MLNVSKFFKQDIVDTNQTLKPYILITDTENNVLFLLGTDSESVNIGDNNQTPIPCIQKVSNVRISTDYDSKKLKINRLRCTLYNYYDVNTKLSEHINQSITSNNLYLFYKSPTTNVIDLSNNPSDYDCALIYNGTISRIAYDDNKIDISVEDSTQIKISDKQVPYMSIDKLSANIYDRILPQYKNDNAVVPMTFGKVGKAPVLPYMQENKENILDLLLDMQPTSGTFKTARIPALFDNNPSGNIHYLYVKKNEDYIIHNHSGDTSAHHNQLYSKITVTAASYNDTEYLIPELQEDQIERDMNLWDIKGFHQRLVENVYANPVGNIGVLNLESIDNTYANQVGLELSLESAVPDDGYINIQSINDNGGYTKKWYNNEDFISSTINNFDTGLENLTNQYGTGRWILLKLEEGVDNNLLNLQIEGQWRGNTFMCADWEMYQSTDGTIPNYENLPLNAYDVQGFYVAPISPVLYRLALQYLASQWQVDYYLPTALNILLFETDEVLDAVQEFVDEGIQNWGNLNFTLPDPTIHLKQFRATNGGKKYWGSRGETNGIIPQEGTYHSFVTEWQNINGLYYGVDGADDKLITNEADSHNLISVFEFGAGYDAIQGLKMNNIGFLHSVKVENYLEQEIYASIIGRKNNYFTEQLDPAEEIEGTIETYPINLVIYGTDGVLYLNEGTMSHEYDSMLDIFYAFVRHWYSGMFHRENIQGYYGSAGEGLEPSAYDLGATQPYVWLPNPPIGSSEFPLVDFRDKLQPDREDIWGDVFANYFYMLTGGSYYVDWYGDTGQFDYYFTWSSDDSFLWNNFDFVKDYIFKPFLITTLNANVGGSPQNLNQYFMSESWVKSIAKEIFQFVFQQNVNYESSFNFTHWELRDDPDYGGYPLEPAETYDLTNAIVNSEGTRQFQWDSFGEIVTTDDWINNYYTYMDDLISSITYARSEVAPLTSYGYNEIINIWPYAAAISEWEGQSLFIDALGEQLNYAASLVDAGEEITPYLTDGIIQKPSDIVMNILTNEMEYGKYDPDNNQFAGQNVLKPDYAKFDMDSIIESRDVHNDWKMGFSVDTKTDGKRLIEDILKESRSYPRFTSSGQYGLMTIKDSYTYDDIDKTIDIKDIIKYKFSQTKREDIITSVKMFYRYDYGQKNFTFDIEKSIDLVLPEYQATGYEDYNIIPIDAYKEMNLKFHTNTLTVEKFANFTLLNNCNVHNLVELTMPLNYMDLAVGDIIHIPLINNETIFNIDYSKVSWLNGQPIYPLWLIMETNIGTTGVKIKAYQLHYLGGDGNHNFQFPEESEYVIIGNTREFNSTYILTNGEPIKNWNYNPLATEDSGYEIPYFDISGDGTLNVSDIVLAANALTLDQYLTPAQLERIKYYGVNTGPSLTVADVVNLLNVLAVN